MSHGYVPVQWNRNKRVYDIVLWISILLFLAGFVITTGLTITGEEALSPMIVLIRSLGACAFTLLNIILCIGPLARLNSRFLPLLYNRRHLGVSMFVVVLVHAVLALIWYHSYGVENPFVSVFTSPGAFSEVSDFPFQPFGAVALVIFLLMAATSHDYWNTNLGASFWKALHMLVYIAYALVIVHVATGAVQNTNTGFSPIVLFISVILVGGLHLAAALKKSATASGDSKADWIDAGRWRDVPNDSGIVLDVRDDERVAIFRYEQTKLAAVSNVCKHQAGPLGEGRIIDGCITCPWHGFQYRPEDGCAPPPFTEKLATYELRVDGERMFLNPRPFPEGMPRPVTIIGESE